MRTATQAPGSGVVPGMLVRLWQAGLFALAVLLVSASSLQAQVTVKTVSGGPSQQNPGSSSGYVDGDTAALAQFNTPTGLAFDPSGNLLYVADTANGALRKLNLSGNQTSTVKAGLNSPVDVAVDSKTNVFVLTQGDGIIRKFDVFGNDLGTFNTSVLSSPTAMAVDSSDNLYVVESNGSLKKVAATTGVVTLIKAAGTFSSPQGIEVMDTGTIAVSDTGNHVIRLVNPTTLVVSLLAGLPGTAGTNNGPAALARFNSPHGLAKAGNNILIVADYGNNQVRQVAADGTTTAFYGVPTNDWFPSDFPGWVDGSASIAEANGPAGVVVNGSGNVFVTEQFYSLIREATGTGLTGPGGTVSGDGTNTVINPPSLTISPNSGYFPMGQTITVTSTSGNVYYTTDGSAPTTNSTPITMNGGVGSIVWFNSMADLTSLRVAAFLTSGTNTVSTNVTGVAAAANVLGVPTSINTNIYAGSGATIVVPVVANLRTNDTIKSFQFRVEVTPVGAAVPINSVQYRVLDITTNDFVKVVSINQGNTPAVVTNFSYTIGSTVGLSVSTLGNSANVNVQKFAVMAMLAIPIPKTAHEGDAYTIHVSNISATSDGQQTQVSLAAGNDVTIQVKSVSYIAGDSSPGRWYNAGDFGDNDLSNSDVNNALSAALGIGVPYAFSDAFNAMDVAPEGTVGDGSIRDNDWQIILLRSLRIPPYSGGASNWVRYWTNGVLVNAPTTISANSPAIHLESLPGNVWNRQAEVGSVPVGNLAPRSTVNMPVYVKVAGNASLTHLIFRAVVTAQNGAPALTQNVQFIPATGISSPILLSFSVNQIGCGWTAGSLNFAASSSNLLGYVTFQIPANAQTGQSYLLQFANADGSPDLQTEYDFETVSATATVGAPAAAAHLVSDDWAIHFFGSVDNPQAAPDADPDGDGIPNWQEYLAGTDPLSASSALVLDVVVTTNQDSVQIQWLTAPGKVYALESTPSLINPSWTTETTVVGDGNYKIITEANNAGSTKFYRVRLVP